MLVLVSVVQRSGPISPDSHEFKFEVFKTPFIISIPKFVIPTNTVIRVGL